MEVKSYLSVERVMIAQEILLEVLFLLNVISAILAPQSVKLLAHGTSLFASFQTRQTYTHSLPINVLMILQYLYQRFLSLDSSTEIPFKNTSRSTPGQVCERPEKYIVNSQSQMDTVGISNMGLLTLQVTRMTNVNFSSYIFNTSELVK